MWLLYILAEVAIHYYIIEVKKQRPFYLHFFLQRGIASIVHGVLLDVQNMSEYLPLLALQVTSFWILFDLGLNISRGKPWHYKGKNSGYIDRLPNTIYWTLKIIALCTMLILSVNL